MNLSDLLTAKKGVIVDRWIQRIFEGYSAESAIFLRREKDRFDNPLGSRISEGIKGLYDALLGEMDTDRVLGCLDEVIRIKAVQDFTPSQAVAFIFLIKQIIREQLAVELRENQRISEELLEFEARIDGVALLGFDGFMKRREKLYELKVNEVRNKVSGLLRKSGMSLE
jgi:hypothetical protein